MISSILSSLIVAGITYLIMYKCCSIICEEKHMSYDDLIKEYQVNGLLRIVLDTFKIVFDVINGILLKYQNNNIIKKTIYRLLFQTDFPEKPILGFNRMDDKKFLLIYLIKLLDGENNIYTDNFKHSIESIWQNKWSFFGYSSYIGEILDEIGDLCYKSKLPIINFLITYKDNTLSYSCFQEKWKDGENGWFKTGINKGVKSYDKKFQPYLKKIIENKDNYKNLLNYL